MKNHDRVYVSGEIKYGSNVYRVASTATLLEKGDEESLVSIDSIDGDSNVWIYVKNNIINEV